MSRTLLVAALSAIAAAPAFAQNATPDIQNESTKPAQAQAVQKNAFEAWAESLRFEESAAPISYDEVLAHPDDADLNYRFARQQVRQGDLKGAAATLQRILLVNPNLPKVRLFYAVVLYRLDDLTEAQLELQHLRELPLTDDVRKELDAYQAAVDKRLKKNHVSGQLGFGWEYDDNRNATPASGHLEFANTPINDATPRTSDTSMLFLGSVEGRHAFSGNNEASLGVDYFRAEQTQLKNLNIQAYSVNAGDAIRTPWDFTVKPSLIFDHALIAQSTFLRDRGAEVRFEHKTTQKTLLFADFSDVYNDYVAAPSFTTAHDFSGVKADFTVGAERTLSPHQKLTLSGGYGVKHAFNNIYAYDRGALDLGHMLLFGKGAFLVSGLTLHYDYYPHVDVFVSGSHRVDKTARLNFTLGAPMSFIHPVLKDVVGTLTYEYYWVNSSVTNYGYTNNKIAALLTYRWDAAF